MDTARYQQERWDLINGPMSLRRNLRINSDGEVYRPERGPIISDSPPWVSGLVGGIHDAVRGVFSLGGELNDVLGGGVLYWDEVGFHVEKKRRLDDSGKPLPYFNLAEAEHQSKDSTTESLIRGFSQFFAGLALTRGAGTGLVTMMGRSAVADFLFDPTHGGLSNWLQDLGVASKVPNWLGGELISDVIDFLAVDVEEEDSAWTKLKGRFKLALEGAGIGIPIDAIMIAFRGLKNNPKSGKKVLDNLVQGLKDFTSETRGSVPRRAPGSAEFRSGLLPMLADLPNRASGEQMLNTLSNPQRLGKYGAKAEEIELIGLDDYLKERGSDVVTKAEVEKYIQDNQIKLETEVTTGGSGWIAENEIDWDLGGSADEVMENLEELQEGRIGRGVVRGYLGDGDESNYVDVLQRTDLDDLKEMDGVAEDLRLVAESEPTHMVNNDYVDPEITSRLEKLRDTSRYVDERGEPIKTSSSYGATTANDVLKKENAVILHELGEIMSNDTVHNSLMRGSTYEVWSEGGSILYRGRVEGDALHEAMASITGDNTGGGTIWSSITYPVRGTEGNVDNLVGENLVEMNYKEGKILMPKGEDDPRWLTKEELKGVSGHRIGGDRTTDQRVFSWFRSTNRGLHILHEDGSSTDIGKGMFTEEYQSDLVQHSRGRWKPKELTKERATREFEASLQPSVDRIHKKIVAWLKDPEGEQIFEHSRIADWSRSDMLMIADDASRVGIEGGVFVSSGENHIRYLMSDIIAHILQDGVLGLSLPRASSFVKGRLKAIAEGEAVLSVTTATGQSRGGSDFYNWRRNVLPKVAEMLSADEVLKLIKLNDQVYLATHGTPDIPMRRSWEEITIKRAIIEAVNDGHRYIAFPSTVETVTQIEKAIPIDAIAKRYTTTTPKILKRLAKRYDAEIHTGALDGSPAHMPSAELGGEEKDGIVIILELTDAAITKITKEGFALPSVIIAGGAGAAATQQAAEQQNGI